jgi:hypothetical protein
VPIRQLKPGPFNPTLPRGGGAGQYVFRKKNMILRGGTPTEPEFYEEAYSGSLNLNETIPTAALTGTVTLTNNSTTVAGTGTAFTTQLRKGQFVLAHDVGQSKSYLLVVDQIASDTSLTITKAPTVVAGGSGITAYRLPVVFDVNSKRGTLIRGNVLEFDKGTLLGVGDGTFRLNGQTISASLVFSTKKPYLALYNAGTYTVFQLTGMPAPASPILSAVAGSGKNMRAGDYGVVLVPSRQATKGYNNGSLAATVTITDGQAIQFTNPNYDTASGNDAWRAYVTVFSADTRVARLGPFYYYGSLITAAGGSSVTLEWIDSEVNKNEALSFNNDSPPDSEFVSSVAGYPVYISCQGKGSTSPGPCVVPAKPNNVEAAPLSLQSPTSPPENILGCVSALGRLFLPTASSLQVSQSTGKTQTSTPQDLPMQTRPFWKGTPFHNPYQLNFINDTLWGFPASGPTRSNAEGDEAAVQKEFAAGVREVISSWNHGQVLCEHDPVNDAWCVFHSGDSLNSSGYWTTRVLMYGLPQQEWIADITLESTTQDMIVSGLASVGGRLEFLAGGRTSGGTVSVGTYRFDAGASQSVSGYMAWAFWDSGVPDRAKCVGPLLQFTGRMASSTAGVHGAEPGETIPVSTLETGNSGSKSGSISLPDSSDVSEGDVIEVNVSNLKQWTVRWDFTWDGTGKRPRLDLCNAAWEVEGARN